MTEIKLNHLVGKPIDEEIEQPKTKTLIWWLEKTETGVDLRVRDESDDSGYGWYVAGIQNGQLVLYADLNPSLGLKLEESSQNCIVAEHGVL